MALAKGKLANQYRDAYKAVHGGHPIILIKHRMYSIMFPLTGKFEPEMTPAEFKQAYKALRKEQKKNE